MRTEIMHGGCGTRWSPQCSTSYVLARWCDTESHFLLQVVLKKLPVVKFITARKGVQRYDHHAKCRSRYRCCGTHWRPWCSTISVHAHVADRCCVMTVNRFVVRRHQVCLARMMWKNVVATMSHTLLAHSCQEHWLAIARFGRILIKQICRAGVWLACWTCIAAATHDNQFGIRTRE